MTVLTKACASLIDYRGKEIYYVDYSNKETIYDLIDSIEQANMYRRIHIENNGKTNVLMLVDLSNSFVFGKALDELKRSAKEIKGITKKRAIVGLNKSKMIFMNSVNLLLGLDIRAFDTIEGAKKWLVE